MWNDRAAATEATGKGTMITEGAASYREIRVEHPSADFDEAGISLP